jgi:hypothetical protein
MATLPNSSATTMDSTFSKRRKTNFVSLVGKQAQSSKLRRPKPSVKSISRAKSNTLVPSIPSSLPSILKLRFSDLFIFSHLPVGCVTPLAWLIKHLRYLRITGCSIGRWWRSFTTKHLMMDWLRIIMYSSTECSGSPFKRVPRRIGWTNVVACVFLFPFLDSKPFTDTLSCLFDDFCASGRLRWNDYIERSCGQLCIGGQHGWFSLHLEVSIICVNTRFCCYSRKSLASRRHKIIPGCHFHQLSLHLEDVI